MSNTSLENNLSVCANCGKGEEASINLKACAACMLVKYCSRDCQAAHRPQHKRECKKRAAELHDEKLFKQPPPLDDCPICFLRMPHLDTARTYMTCCGKVICSGCIYAFKSKMTKEEDNMCPFCRTPMPTSIAPVLKRLATRMDLNDADAISSMGCYYSEGNCGLPQNMAKALELWHRAAELGHATSYYGIGNAYARGDGVERNEKKAMHYWKLAAMEGHVTARNNIGATMAHAGNYERALKHYMIAVKDGSGISLQNIKRLYSKGHATKDDYAKALRSYQAYLNEIKSDQRDEAATAREEFKYYGDS